MDYEKLKISSGKHWDVYLHENQCYIGRVFILLKNDAGIEDFLSIEGDIREEFFHMGDRLKGTLKRLFNPDKMNYAALSNTSEKIHVHCVPRYREPREFKGRVFKDERWGKNYAPYDRSFVIPENELIAIKEYLKQEFGNSYAPD